MYYFNYTSSSTNCKLILDSYVQNLTISYADKSNEASMVATSAVMFLLAALFFILNLFSRVSDVSAILHPTARLFLTSSLSLFLPVMSYLFSEAKNSSLGSNQTAELSLRARTILAWMLLVELLRKKVEAILVTAGMQGYSSSIDRATRIGWLGYLVFFNLKSAGKKTIYGFLWVLAAAKLVQRVAINELLKRSPAYGKNAQRLHSYMDHILQLQEQQGNVPVDGSELLKSCKYAVMGEEELEMEANPEDNHLHQPNKTTTVGEIWTLAERDHLLRKDHRLKRLCLSFALFKLLRRRFENFPITDGEAHNCRDLIFRGLCRDGTDREAIAVALFQVLNDELHFLCEYYHSVLPVVLSNTFFLVANYILFPIIISAGFLLTIILCSNGDLFYAFRSIRNDNLAISTGIMKMTGCILNTILQSPPALFSTIDLAITMLLVLAVVYEEVWEFIVFILSNWFMVSLLRDYTAKPHWRDRPTFRGAIRGILWVRNSMSKPKLCFRQLSELGGFLTCRHSLAMSAKVVPMEVKKSIMQYLLTHVEAVPVEVMKTIMQYLLTHVECDAPLSNGWSALAAKHPEYHSQLSWACQSDSVAEVILTWHIATCLLEARYPRQKGATTTFRSDRRVATTLSKYCTYLVAFCPELLPDNLDGTQRAYDAMKRDMKKVLGCWVYFSPVTTSWCDKMLQVAEQSVEAPVWKGAKAGKILISKAEADEAQVWKLLADVWTELVVYVAPSNGDVHVKAHKEALAKGGEFITVLWALAMHTGITRPASKPWAVATWPSSPVIPVIPVQQVIPVLHVDGLGAASVPSTCV